jgi:hypothetical protein
VIAGIVAVPTAVVPITLTNSLLEISLEVCPEAPQQEHLPVKFVAESSFIKIAILTSLLIF